MVQFALLRPAVFLLALSFGLTSCGKSRGPSRLDIRPVDAVRLLSDGGELELRWDQPAGRAPDRYAVYRATQPITDTNRALAEVQTVRNTEIRIALERDSGVHYFAIAPITDAPSRLGPLSAPFEIDTTQRIAWVESSDSGTDLVIANLTGEVVAQRRIPSRTQIEWSPTGTRVAFLENAGLSFLPEQSGSNGFSLLSHAPPVGIASFQFDASGDDFAILGRDRGTDHPLHLYRHTDGGVSTPVSLALKPGTRVASFQWIDGARRLAFLSNQSSVDADQLFRESGERGGSTVNEALATAYTITAADWARDRGVFAYLSVLEDTRQAGLIRGDTSTGERGLIAAGTTPEEEILRWSPDGATLAVVLQTADDVAPNLHLFAGGSHASPIADLAEGDAVVAIEWAPHSAALAALVMSSDRAPRLLHVDTGDETVRSLNDSLAAGDTVATIEWSPTATQVAALIRNGTARVDVSTASGERTSALRRDEIDSVDWAEDGRHLLVLAGGSLHVLDTELNMEREISDTIGADVSITEFHVARLGWRRSAMLSAELELAPRSDDVR